MTIPASRPERSGPATVAAVDLGAASGRVMLGEVAPDRLALTEVHRFDNVPVAAAGTLYWDILAIYRGILDGLARLPATPHSIGIDGWGVDYGLIDDTGALLGNPVHYRDERTASIVVPDLPLYPTTGIQHLPFNTLFQLAAEPPARLAAAERMLLIPDLLCYWLTGEIGAEQTNASTTQLLDATTREWSAALLSGLGLDPGLFPPLRRPGDPAGLVGADVLAATGLTGPLPVTAVASHDTASAVAAIPAAGERFAYISCGTWALAGVELERPVLTEASRAANFTNEIGIDATVRYLRNVMGLWLLQECLRTWRTVDLDEVLRAAAQLPPFGCLVDPDDPAFLPPGDMPARIASVCRDTGQSPPAGPAETVRCIVDSLALAFRRCLRTAVELSGRDVDVVHLVGGGARNELLCQLTADACGRPVLAGPVECSALGNVLVQARALGVLAPDRWSMRALVRATQPIRRYEPDGDDAPWAAAESRVPWRL